jgi:hypothetical protein
MGETWEEVGKLTLWKPTKEGETLTGKVVSERTHEKFGKSWTIETSDGEITTPSHAVLQNRLSNIKIGDKVRITYQGTQPAKIRGNSPTVMYLVEKAK